MHILRGGGPLSGLAAALVLTVSCDEAPGSREARASSGAANDPSVVARVGDREITLGEVDQRALRSNMMVFQQLYDARKQAIEELLAEALLEQEAQRLGVSREELETREIRSKIAEVTPKDIEDFFNQNRSRIPPDQTLDQLSGQIRDFLAARNEATARQGYLTGLREKAVVDVSLDPPRVPITVAQGEPVKGGEDASVTIVEYSDFQ
jgi:hypothetical protein